MIAEHAMVHQPSSLYRTVGCTGWKQLSMDIEQPETVESREGTASHFACEEMLRCRLAGHDNQTSGLIGLKTPNGVILTEEMTDAAEFYVQDVWRTCVSKKMSARLHVEHRVEIPQVHKDMFGTPDAFCFDPITETLYVWDYKYGHGTVDGYRNWQLAAYARGIVNYLNVTPKSIVIRIIMPRCFDEKGPVREWITDMMTINNMMASANVRCHEADSIDAKLTAGSHCKDCPARARCLALRQSTANIIQYVSSPVDVSEAEGDWLAIELNALKDAEVLLKSRKDALEEQIKQRIYQGARINGFTLETAYGRDTWTIDPDELIETCELMGVNVAKPVDVVTPSQAANLFKKNNIDPSVISHYHSKPEIGKTLIKDTTNRARIIFKDLKNG